MHPSNPSTTHRRPPTPRILFRAYTVLHWPMANRMDDLGKVGVWQVLSLRQPPVVAVASSKIAISHHRQPPSNLKIDQPRDPDTDRRVQSWGNQTTPLFPSRGETMDGYQIIGISWRGPSCISISIGIHRSHQPGQMWVRSEYSQTSSMMGANQKRKSDPTKMAAKRRSGQVD